MSPVVILIGAIAGGIGLCFLSWPWKVVAGLTILICWFVDKPWLPPIFLFVLLLLAFAQRTCSEE